MQSVLCICGLIMIQNVLLYMLVITNIQNAKKEILDAIGNQKQTEHQEKELP